jgi:FkbH-like protein
MKQTLDLRMGTPVVSLPQEALNQFASLARGLRVRSQIVWEEHCTECAFPACFSACAFYTPRPDFGCRRFERGIETVQSGGLSLMRVRFRKWGKLQGKGPLRLITPENAGRREQLYRRMDFLLGLIPDQRLASHAAWRLTRRKESGSSGADLAQTDAFVIEAFLADPVEIPFTLTIVPRERTAAGLFQERFVLGRGYNRVLLPTAHIATVDLARPFLVKIEPLVEAPPHDVILGFLDFAAFTAPLPAISQAARGAAGPAKTAKCVVWDLDNVIWRGTLAEDGVDKLVLNTHAVAAMKALDSRGVLHSIASKNDPGPALAALERFGLRDLVLFPQIGWGPKSDAVRTIAGLLDIGLDAFVFIDDQVFERAEVSHALPMVRTLSDADIHGLIEKPFFNVPVTAESAKRRAMYRDEEQRRSAFAESSTDYVAFLRSCRIVLEVSRPSHLQAERLFELSERTNQLNFAASRLSRDEIEKLVRGTHPLDGFVLRCIDRFGDYGVIGLVLIDTARATIEAFFMSCRVQRKRVEQAFFAFLSELLSAQGHKELRVRFKSSAKNAASVRLLEELGFTLGSGTAEGEGLFIRPLAPDFDPDRVVRVMDLSGTRPEPRVEIEASG